MTVFLYSPVFQFTQRLVEWLQTNYPDPRVGEEDSAKRLLISPTISGLRVRNMAETLEVDVAWQGLTVLIEYSKDRVCHLGDSQYHGANDIAVIGKAIYDYFVEQV